MTQAELAVLKEQIKSELLAEMSSIQRTGHWHKIKKELESRLAGLEPKERDQTSNAISTIIRLTFGINAIAKLKDAQVNRAREMANKILETMGR